MDSKLKLALFGTANAVLIIIIIGLFVFNGQDPPVRRSSTEEPRTLTTSSNFIKCQNLNEVYHEDPITGKGMCILKSPSLCGNNMILAEIIEKKNGTVKKVCKCDVDSFARPLVYHEESRQCYFIFTKAYCSKGEWLAVRKGTGPICERKICNKLESEEYGISEMVPLKGGRCVELGKNDNVTCSIKSQVIKFFKRKIYPACKYRERAGKGRTVFVRSYRCPEGYFSTKEGHCQPDFDFD